jgi:hypothetical protein
MAAPTKINFKLQQGSTFSEVIRWESANIIYTDITNITKAAPMVVTAPGHGAVTGWRAKITNVTGMTDINTMDYAVITASDLNTVTFNSINSFGFKTYVSGGILEYNQPISLAPYTARMQIRQKITSTTILETLTTENGLIILDDTLKTITITIPALTTETYTFKSAVYSLEMINGTIVTPLAYGNITLVKEVTR